MPAVMRSSRSTTAADCRSSAARASRRCRGHARSRYRPNVAGSVSIRNASAVDAQSTTTWSHCPEPASSPTSCRPSTSCMPGSADSSSGATSARSESGKRAASGPATSLPARLQQRQRVQRQCVEEPAAGVDVVLEHPVDAAFTRRAHRGAEHVPERVRLVGGHHEHPKTRACVADRGGRGQCRLAYPAFTDKETDAQRGGGRELTQPRLVS